MTVILLSAIVRTAHWTYVWYLHSLKLNTFDGGLDARFYSLLLSTIKCFIEFVLNRSFNLWHTANRIRLQFIVTKSCFNIFTSSCQLEGELDT